MIRSRLSATCITNALIILTDCAASRDVEQRKSELVSVASSVHIGNQRLGSHATDDRDRKAIQREHCCITSLLHHLPRI